MADDDGILPGGGVMSMTEQPQKTLDEQFHDVSIAIAESRDFTEFCFARVDTKVNRLETKVDALDTKVTSMATNMDRRFTRNELLLSEVLNEVRALSRAR